MSFKSCTVLLFLFVAAEIPLKGYVDPGSGSLIWQVLAGGFVGLLFQVRKVTKWFRSRKGD